MQTKKLFAALGSLFVASSAMPTFAIPPTNISTTPVTVPLDCKTKDKVFSHTPTGQTFQIPPRIIITNSTPDTIPKGTIIHWKKLFTAVGTETLFQDLTPGNVVVISQNLYSSTCSASFLSNPIPVNFPHP